jgi:hypothetical protein
MALGERPMNHAYSLATLSRPKAILQDLIDIAAEAEIDFDTSRAKEAVAAMLGYETWKSLKRSIGSVDGPEDYQLGSPELETRRAAQMAALRSLGFDHGQSVYALEQLRPTSRALGHTAAGHDLMPSAGKPSDYHPTRLEACLDGFYDILGNHNRDDGGMSWYDINRIVKAWYQGQNDRTFSDFDRETIEQDLLPSRFGRCSFGRTDFLHDARDCKPPQYGFADMTAQIPHFARGRTHYVHFGANAFPSPYPGIGIEGAYVALLYKYEENQALPNEVCVHFVCSGETVSGNRHCAEEAIYLARGVSYSYNAEIFTDPLTAREDDGSGDKWGPYLRAPLYAALSAIKAFSDRAVTITNAVCGGMTSERKMALYRSASEHRLNEARVMHYGPAALVRILGSAPADSKTRTAM